MSDPDHIAMLKEENAWLRSELKLQNEQTQYERIRRNLGLSPAEFLVVMALYDTGRVLSQDYLERILPSSQCRAGERTLKLIQGYVCHIRQSIGYGAIATVWGGGYRLTNEGRLILREALGQARVAA